MSTQTEQEAKHTPGPLFVKRGIENALTQGHVITTSDKRQIVAECPRMADATLYAAAPELLEALAEVLSTGLNGGNNYRLAMMAASRNVLDAETLEKAEASERAVNKAYAAINKALGKE